MDKYREGLLRISFPPDVVSKHMLGIISMHVAIKKLYLLGYGRFHLVIIRWMKYNKNQFNHK